MAEPMAEPAEPGEIEAAGAIVWRDGPDGPDGPEVLLIHRPRRDDWSLAKGKRDPGEKLPQTAVREVAEETGVRVHLGRRLRSVRYLASGQPKNVHYWAAADPVPRDHTTSSFVPNEEVDGIEWLTLARAYERLSYPDDIIVLDDFVQSPHRTVPLIILRHASAGRKEDWDGDDLLRPLDAQGEADAQALVLLLACFGPVRVVSSPALRCTATIALYAAHIGAPVEVDAAFGVPDRAGGSSLSRTDMGDPGSAITRLLADGVPALVCGHRENIPELLRAACEYLGAKPPPAPSVPKAGFWVLQAGTSTLAGMERYDVSSPD
jgi:8-oxo-(d)GTP phosphatase